MGKKEKNNKRSHGISAEAERHAFRTISRKVGQSKRDPGPSKLGRHRRLLCSFETFPPAPVPPEGRGLAECDPRRKELLQRGQQNKSSHIANVKWATPPHFPVIIAQLRTCVSSRTSSFLKKPFRRSPQMQ
ncbi:putative myosin heavy chain [Trypanosoma cruzi]|nr:putative myosin heavy chain [Trypanosoma cruzi]